MFKSTDFFDKMKLPIKMLIGDETFFISLPPKFEFQISDERTAAL